MEIHIESSLKAKCLVSVCAIVNWVVTIRARRVCVGFGESRFEDLVLGVIFGVEASLSASMVAQTEVFDKRQLARGTALLPDNGLKRDLKGERADS